MKSYQEPLFQMAFDLASTAQFIVKADSPHFTIAGSNKQHKIITGNQGNKLTGKSIWEVINLHPLEVNSNATLMKGFNQAILNKKTIKLPSF